MGGRGANIKARKPSDNGMPNDATEWYVSGEGMWVNQYLRGKEGFGELSDFEKQMLNDLDKATNGIIKDDTLYRSVDASAVFGDISNGDYADLMQYLNYGPGSFGKGAYADGIRSKVEKLINKTLGKSVTEKGFMSTTSDRSIAEEFRDFTGSEKPIVMKITNAKGAKGVDLSAYDKNASSPQKERLLARGQRYEVERIHSENGEICVDIRLK